MLSKIYVPLDRRNNNTLQLDLGSDARFITKVQGDTYSYFR